MIAYSLKSRTTLASQCICPVSRPVQVKFILRCSATMTSTTVCSPISADRTRRFGSARITLATKIGTTHVVPKAVQQLQALCGIPTQNMIRIRALSKSNITMLLRAAQSRCSKSLAAPRGLAASPPRAMPTRKHTTRWQIFGLGTSGKMRPARSWYHTGMQLKYSAMMASEARLRSLLASRIRTRPCRWSVKTSR